MNGDLYPGREPDQRPFTDDFELLAFNEDGGLLRAAEIRLIRNAKPYLLRVETFDLNTARAVDDEDLEATDNAYVVAADEILPSDLVDLRNKSFEELEPFLSPEES